MDAAAGTVNIQQVMYSLQQHGLAVLPSSLINSTTLHAMQQETAALLEQAEAGCMHGGSCTAKDVAEQQGCIFQVLQEAGVGHRARQDAGLYFTMRSSWPYCAAVAAFLQAKTLLDVLQAALSSTQVLLYNEQYIIKPPHSRNSAFHWHYDSQSCSFEKGVDYAPYLSLWVALDDMTEQNGSLVVLPWSKSARSSSEEGNTERGSQSNTRPGQTDVQLQQSPNMQSHFSDDIPHASSCADTAKYSQQQAQTNENSTRYVPVHCTEALLQHISPLSNAGFCSATTESSTSAVMPRGTEAGGAQVHQHDDGIQRPLGLLMPAGTAVLFWDDLWHCSGPNSSRYTRSAYMAQFSSKALTWKDSGKPVGLAVRLRG